MLYLVEGPPQPNSINESMNPPIEKSSASICVLCTHIFASMDYSTWTSQYDPSIYSQGTIDKDNIRQYCGLIKCKVSVPSSTSSEMQPEIDVYTL